MIGDNSKSFIKACELGNTRLALLLLNNFTDINCFNGLALIKSIEGCHYDLVLFLLTNGANIEPIENSLISQTISKSPQIVKLLLEYGLDLNILSDKVIKKLISHKCIDWDENINNNNNNNDICEINIPEEIIDDFGFDEFTISV